MSITPFPPRVTQLKKDVFSILVTNLTHCTLTHFIDKSTIHRLRLDTFTPIEFSSMSIQGDDNEKGTEIQNTETRWGDGTKGRWRDGNDGGGRQHPWTQGRFTKFMCRRGMLWGLESFFYRPGRCYKQEPPPWFTITQGQPLLCFDNKRGLFAHLVLRWLGDGRYIVIMLKDRHCQSNKNTDCCVCVCWGEGPLGSCVCCMYSGGRAAPSPPDTNMQGA